MIGLYIIFIISIFVSTNILPDVWNNAISTYGSDSTIVRVCVPWVLLMIVYWLHGIFWLLIDYYNVKWFRRLQPVKSNHSILKCIRVVLFNQVCVLLPTMMILDYYFSIDFASPLPSAMTIFLQLIQVFVAGEFLYYYSHRCLHHPILYRYVHKIHHEYTNPIGIAAIYCHPIEMIVNNILPLVGPLYFFNVHGYALYIGLILGFYESVADHSGYDVSFEIELGSIHSDILKNVKGNYHDKHHELFNCNYGSFKFLDYIHGTLVN